MFQEHCCEKQVSSPGGLRSPSSSPVWASKALGHMKHVWPPSCSTFAFVLAATLFINMLLGGRPLLFRTPLRPASACSQEAAPLWHDIDLIEVVDDRWKDENPIAVDWAQISVNPTHEPCARTAERWIIVHATVRNATADVAELAAMEGWQLLVVGTTGTSLPSSAGGALLLSMDTQRRGLGFEVEALLPVHSPARKVLGFLYAVRCGAEMILEAEEGLVPAVVDVAEALRGGGRQGQHICTPQKLDGVDYAQGVLNPFPHFGQPGLWPLGFPPAALGEAGGGNVGALWEAPSDTLNVKMAVTMVQGGGGADPMARVAQARGGRCRWCLLDDAATPLTLPRDVFTPSRAAGTLYHKEAFWAALLPARLPVLAAEVCRSYWAQRLLWEMGGVMEVLPPVLAQSNDSRASTMTLEGESLSANWTAAEGAVGATDVAAALPLFLRTLKKWEARGPAFFDRVLDLSQHLVSANIWSSHELQLVEAFLTDLLAAGYQQPELRRTPELGELGGGLAKHADVALKDFSGPIVPSCPICRPRTELHERPLLVCPKLCPPSLPAPPPLPAPPCRCAPPTAATCPGSTVLRPSGRRPAEECAVYSASRGNPRAFPEPTNEERAALVGWREAFKGVVLVVNFNFPNHQSAAFLHKLYGRVFETVVMISSKDNPELGIEDAPIENGWRSYRVLPAIIRQYPKAVGYLWTNDDVALNYWSLSRLDKNKTWANHPCDWMLKHLGCHKRDKYDWEEDIKTKDTMDAAMKAFTPQQARQLNASLGPGMYAKMISDVFYLPQRVAAQVADLVPKFVQVNALSEVAVPTILAAADDFTTFEPLDMVYLWYNGERKLHPATFYSTEIHGLHPWKLSKNEEALGLLWAMSRADPTVLEIGDFKPYNITNYPGMPQTKAPT